MSETCLLTILNKNDKLKNYYDKLIKSPEDTNNLNMYSQKNVDSFKKKYIWHQVLTWTKKIILVTILISAVSAGAVHVLPNLHEQIHKLGDNFSEFDEQLEKAEDFYDKLHDGLEETISGGARRFKLQSQKNLFGGTLRKNVYNNVKGTLTNIIKKLANYDLMIEIYRSNLIIAKDLLDKIEDNIVLDNLYQITIKHFFKSIIEAYQCFGINIRNDKLQDMLIYDSGDDQLNYDLDESMFNKSTFSKIYNFFNRKKDKSNMTDLCSNCLFAIITQFEDMEQKISPIIVTLNSYITRLNLLVDIVNCKGDTIIINNFKPVFGSLISKLIEHLNNDVSIKSKIAGKSQEDSKSIYKDFLKLQDSESVPLTNDESLRLLLTHIKGKCATDQFAKNSKGCLGILKPKTNKKGEQVVVQNWEIDDIYNEVENNEYFEKIVIGDTDHTLCEGAKKEYLELCKKDKSTYIKYLKRDIREKLGKKTDWSESTGGSIKSKKLKKYKSKRKKMKKKTRKSKIKN